MHLSESSPISLAVKFVEGIFIEILLTTPWLISVFEMLTSDKEGPKYSLRTPTYFVPFLKLAVIYRSAIEIRNKKENKKVTKKVTS